MITVENLSLQYGDQIILDHVSFSFTKGQIIGLLGPNGAGKSSIIKILSGLVFPKTGKLTFNEQEAYSFADLRQHCGYLIDSPAFYPYLTAKENLNLVKTINNVSVDIEELLVKVGLTNVETKKVKHFSTGMKQRLAIAQALLRSPEVLILDEPFNGLDPNGFQDLIALLKSLNSEGTTIVVSSHLLNELEQFADAFILIHQGRIALNLTKEELLVSKKKVTFTFDTNINEAAEQIVNEKKGNIINVKTIVMRLHPSEIAKTVKYFVDHDCTPVNVETHTILQEKYFEIAV